MWCPGGLGGGHHQWWASPSGITLPEADVARLSPSPSPARARAPLSYPFFSSSFFLVPQLKYPLLLGCTLYIVHSENSIRNNCGSGSPKYTDPTEQLVNFTANCGWQFNHRTLQGRAGLDLGWSFTVRLLLKLSGSHLFWISNWWQYVGSIKADCKVWSLGDSSPFVFSSSWWQLHRTTFWCTLGCNCSCLLCQKPKEGGTTTISQQPVLNEKDSEIWAKNRVLLLFLFLLSKEGTVV